MIADRQKGARLFAASSKPFEGYQLGLKKMKEGHDGCVMSCYYTGSESRFAEAFRAEGLFPSFKPFQFPELRKLSASSSNCAS